MAYRMNSGSPRRSRKPSTTNCLLLAAVLAGVFAGCGSDDQAKKELAAARAEARRITDDAHKRSQSELDTARRDIETEQDAAKDTLSDTRQQISDARARLRSERRKLRKLEGQVGGVRRQIAQNTFPGTGTFVVGSDVAPGTYRAAAQPGCYWARLSSLDTSDIADNDNADGPVVIELLPSDKAIKVSDCADFHKVG